MDMTVIEGPDLGLVVRLSGATRVGNLEEKDD